MNTELEKAKAEKLAKKLRRSIKGIRKVLNLAKKNGGNIPAAARTLGKTRNYVNCGMFFLRAAEKANNIQVPEIAKLEAAIRSAKRIKRKARFERTGKIQIVSARKAPVAKVASKRSNVLSHLAEGAVEFKYPVITDRPVTKIVETYPLKALQPGHAFAVPASKGHIMAVKKAVTQFARKNPGQKFLQLKDKGEFVTWRTK